MANKVKKDSYTAYKTENRAEKNKIRRLERHCKKHPEDVENKKNLERLKKDGYTPRAKPLNPGSNPTVPKVKLGPYEYQETIAEKLAKLLNIPLPKTYKSSKPKITHRKRRNVKA